MRSAFGPMLGRVLALLLVGSTVACSGRLGSPESTLKQYARALEEHRGEDAYRVLSEETRRSLSKEAFLRTLRDYPEDAREMGQALHREPISREVTATVITKSGDEILLVLEEGEWKIDTTAVDLYAIDTPKHTVSSFLRALERKRYDVLLRMVPEEFKAGLDAEKLKKSWEGPEKESVDRFLAMKATLLTTTAEIVGDNATLAYGSETMKLVRERGKWKVLTFGAGK